MMRLRKPAEKLLACTSEYRTASPPPMPLDSADPILAAAGLLCELNRSSWVDDSSINHAFSKHEREVKLEAENEKDEEEGEICIVRNVFEGKEEELEDIKLCRARKRKEKGLEAVNGVIKCKKTDGKGWHCRREAQLPHTLCSYHLTQLRSYRARFETQRSSHRGNGTRRNRSKKSASPIQAAAAAGAASNYCYYYYSILGPCWGKRRGLLNECSESNDKSETAPPELNGKSTDHEALADVDNAGDDEEVDGGNCCNVDFKKKKRPIKKRGRKPMKARSLKSLL